MNHKTIGWIAAVILVLLLWQVKGLHPVITGVILLITLGLLLRFYPTIRTQFSNIGK